ncbi:hypothetical protein ACGFYV_33800 [Streptomyces sp. NPDC048297]|uniref:hypothetical protein n=1 Tax=Streptomyces sp. NPDC048297 TaxID=3365531 RepID=UPI0037189495
MRDFIRRRRLAISVSGVLAIIGVGATIWALGSHDSSGNLKAADTCNEGIFSSNLEPLERLLPHESSFHSTWSRVATDTSFKITCDNRTSRGVVNMSAEMKNGNKKDWLAGLGSRNTSDASAFKAGTSALAWRKQAAIYAECKPHTEGSSYTAGFGRPYLSITVTANGSAASNDETAKEDLAQLASRIFFEAQLQTGCQEDFTPPPEPPRMTQ